MTQVKEIKQAIRKLPKSDYVRIRRWLLEMDWKRWDKQFEEDVKSGRLDALSEKAIADYKKGKCKEL